MPHLTPAWAVRAARTFGGMLRSILIRSIFVLVLVWATATVAYRVGRQREAETHAHPAPAHHEALHESGICILDWRAMPVDVCRQRRSISTADDRILCGGEELRPAYGEVPDGGP